jgi:hypothetical protein
MASITHELIEKELIAAKDHVTEVDILFAKGADTASISSVVTDQYSKVKAENADLSKQITTIDAEIIGKETEFVDIKRNVAEPQWYSGLFTQQDWLTVALAFAYLFLSVSYYIKIGTLDGFNLRGLAGFLVSWGIMTTLGFVLFNRYV